MKHPRKCRSSRRRAILALAASSALLSSAMVRAQVAGNRLLGVDVSDWQQEDSAGNPLAPVDWALLHAPVSSGGGGKDFAFIRSTRGGTTGTYNKFTGTGTLSHRYDDYRFVENITNATAAGVYAGMYHFGRPDVAGNTGLDEANHMLEVAGNWMKPGYLRPVFDLEAGDGLSVTDLSNWSVEFANRILEVKGIAPICYVNQNYALNEVNSTVPAAMPINWVARWPNQTYNGSIDAQNIDPVPAPISQNVYGVWNPSFPTISTPQPWYFWQYGSRTSNIPGLLGNSSGLNDVDVAHGDHEFMKDMLVPALWTTDSSGDWSTLANWNSNNPDYDSGDPSTGPSPRLPGQIGMTNGNNDTVILERSTANPTITLSTGTHTIRKLFVRENFNITGGSLTVGYVPTPAKGGNVGAGPITAQFSDTVTISGGLFSAHTLQVDGTRIFNVNGGVLSFNTLDLQSHATTGAQILMGGNVAITPLAGATATIKSSGGLASTGLLNLGGASRLFTVNDGSAAVDLLVNVPITNGSLVKGGTGTMHLTATNTYAGGTSVSAGTLIGTVASLPGNVSNSGTLVFEDTAASTYSGVVSGSGALVKRGAGALTFSAAQTLAGPVTLERGNVTLSGAAGALASAASTSLNAMTLTLSNTGANNNNRLSNGPLALNAGTLTFTANTTTESTGALNAGGGASTVTLGGSGTSSITFASLARSAGATINFNGVGGTNSAIVTAGVAGAFIDQGTFANDADYAVYNGSKVVLPMTIGAGANEYATTITAGRHVKLSASASGVTSTAIETLNLAGATVGATLSPAQTLTLSRGGIIKSGNGSGSIAGGAGSVLAAPSNVEYVINTAGASDTLTISLPVTGGSGLTKTGPGTLSLTGANTYAGSTTINNGVLLAGPANLGGGSLVIAHNGRFKTAASFDTGKSVVLPVGAGGLDTNGFDSTFFGNVTGTGGLTKYGTGTLVLNGPASALSASTFIDAGTLAAASTNLGDGGRLNELEIGNGTLRTLGSINTSRKISIVGGSAGVDTNGYDSTFTGVFTGNGNLTKSGAGTLVINSPDNTYTGSTTVAAGTLAIAPNHLSNSGGLSFTTGGRLRLIENSASSAPVAFNTGGGSIDTDGYAGSLSGVVSGSGALTKSGFGTLVLTANNTHTGAVNVNNGTLRLDGAGGALASSLSYTINGGGILRLDNGASNNANRIGSGAITLNAGMIWLYGGSGGTTESAGNLTAASGANTIIIHAGTPSTLALGTYTRSAGASLNFINASTTLKTTFSGGVTAGSFIDQGTFVGGNYAVYDAAGHVRAMVAGAGDSDWATTVTAARHVKLAAAASSVATTSIYTLNLTNVNFGLAGGATLTLSKGGILKTGTTENTISGGTALTTSPGVELVVSVNGATDLLTISTPITAGSGLTKTGEGRLTLSSASNTYAGTTTIAQGTLRLGANNVIPNTSNVFIADNNNLGVEVQLDMGGRTETIGNLTMVGGKIFNLPGATAATLTLNGAANSITYTGVSNKGATIAPNTLALGTATGMTDITVADGDGDTDLTISGVMSNGTGTHGINKLGAGTLELTAANTFTGAVNVNAGTLKLTGSTAGGSIVNVGTGGTLTGGGTILESATLTGNGVINFTGTIGNQLNMTGGNWLGAGTVTGLATNTSGVFTIGPGANMTANSSLVISGGTIAAAHANSTLTGTLNYTSPSSSTWLGNVTGSGKALILNNTAAVLTLTGSNTCTGQTSVNGGILRLTRSDNITSSFQVVTSMTGSVGGTVQLTNDISVNRPLVIGGAGLNGSSLTPPGTIGALDSLSGSNTWAGNITLNGTGSGGVDPLLNQISAAAGSTLTLTGVIQNGAATSSWAKTGDGDVVLAGGSPNTYNHLSRLSGGRLIIEKNGALGTAGSTSAASGNFFQLPGSASTLAFRSTTSLNYSTFEVLNTDGTGAPGYGQIDNLGGNNTFAGSIALAGPVLSGSTLASTIGVTSGSLDVQGGLYARGSTGTRDITKLGAGTLIVSNSVASANPLVVPLADSTFHVNAGTVEHRGPTPTTNLLAGITTWNVNNGGTLKQSTGSFASTSVNVPTGGTLRYDGGSMSITNLNVPGGQALVSQGGNKVLRAGTVSVSSGGKIDLADNDLIVQTSPIGSHNGTNYTGVTGLIESGRNAGVWNGNGITTSMSDATSGSGYTVLGVALASEARSIGPTDTDTWNGQTVTGSDTLVMYTYGGDANLSGVVDVDDYGQIDFNAAVGGILTGWYNGDFDYSGGVDVDDYGIIDFVVNIQGPPLGSAGGMTISTVPEPTTLLPIALATLAMRRRRTSTPSEFSA